MWAAIWAIIQAIAAYLIYRYDPKQIERRDEINKKAALESGLEGINQVLADKNTLGIGFFISEFLRVKGPDSAPGWAADLLNRKLPTPRSAEDRDKDPTPGIDIGK